MYLFKILLWPFLNFYNLLTYDWTEPVPKAFIKPYKNLKDNVTSCIGALRAFGLAYGAIYYVSPMIQPKGIYPAFDKHIARTFEFGWILPIVFRNLVATAIIAGGWDYTLHFSPFKKLFQPFKFNPKYATREQIKHDMFWTFIGTMMGSLVEILYLYALANELVPSVVEMNLFHPNYIYTNAIWILFISHWRLAHFYVIHRLMHPWKTKSIPDIGKWLYKHVHSLHHKSNNPTAFSGTSMHPVESFLYYSACYCALPFGVHPCIVIGCLVDCAVGAWLGHDGFQSPGAGDYFHYLHHAHFDCNYGATHVPFDYLFGTFVGEKKHLNKVWKGKKKGSYGLEGNSSFSIHEEEKKKEA